MKIIIADFEISRYGGITEHVVAKVKALKELGHTVDLVKFTASPISDNAYKKRIKAFEDGSYQAKLVKRSEYGGIEFNEDTGYWKSNYLGFFLPPSNRIGVFESNAFDKWHKIIDDADLIMWNFMPTKAANIWGKRDFSFWWKFFDLPSKIKQIFIAHDAYFDVRACNVSALKEKISLIECAHLAAYHCCENIGIPRILLLNPRYMKATDRMPIVPMNKRKTDLFAAHVFKSMKHMEDLIRAFPYMRELSLKVAGSGVEQGYMMADEKCKEVYRVSRKYDPDVPECLVGEKIWDVAEVCGMEYLGLIPSKEVNQELLQSKFAIDPSWSEHYSKYCRTHINGFIIEAILMGCYPVLRDYKGLAGDIEIYDPLFNNIHAIIIPWNATPKQFAEELLKARQMSPKKYLTDTLENYQLICELFNAKKNMQELLRIVNGGEKEISKLEIGEDSENVKKVTREIMEDFFHIELPIQWETS